MPIHKLIHSGGSVLVTVPAAIAREWARIQADHVVIEYEVHGGGIPISLRVTPLKLTSIREAVAPNHAASDPQP